MTVYPRILLANSCQKNLFANDELFVRFFVLTSVYRNPTFMGQYTHWDLFGPKKRKINLIGSLVHRALEICFLEKFSIKVNKSKISCDRIDIQKKSLFLELRRKFQISKKFGPEKFLIYLKLLWIGNISLKK